ncbi:hypothetical protein HYQ45_015606 [Verticillium longisporum]|uniref:Uncharacterized protein n=1 Tax=Verticillium longisporum TaxID=100787 RepID=A0A0G4LF97_VERLO|nr:hypothetical protein HYQ45_015606 [Verticillium longisporum]CRK20723.1 hypothetical protein BN1723_002690 [Verticillium longisporum]CRK26680.1 hypothetical protein BN1708_014641 [Verticillium longisporum]
MVPTASVLRFPRSDEEGSFVLVNAAQTRTKPLALKLVGTDGLAPYVASLRHDRVAALLVKNSPCAEEEWVDILSGLLTQNPGDGVEAIATVESEVAITITVRRRVKGITQRLGTLELKHNADEEIELFDWCVLAAAAVVQANVTLAAVTTKQTELEASVWQLKSQLDELVEAKKTDETELLLKFRDLLNAKKVKIREQQKILAAAASGDPAALPPSQTSQPSKPTKTAGQGRTATKSRASKRKAAAHAAEEDDDDESDFEKMDVDTAASKEADAEMSDQQRDTTDAETETASEHDEDDAEEEEAKPARPARVQEDDAPPPARALPFMKKTAKKAAPAPPPTGSETESDDEL